jgi:hypothetical protein
MTRLPEEEDERVYLIMEDGHYVRDEKTTSQWCGTQEREPPRHLTMRA